MSSISFSVGYPRQLIISAVCIASGNSSESSGRAPSRLPLLSHIIAEAPRRQSRSLKRNGGPRIHNSAMTACETSTLREDGGWRQAFHLNSLHPICKQHNFRECMRKSQAFSSAYRPHVCRNSAHVGAEQVLGCPIPKRCDMTAVLGSVIDDGRAALTIYKYMSNTSESYRVQS